MRLRNDPHAFEYLKSNSDIFILNANEYKGEWKKFFQSTKPIYIELGMGKGQFIVQQALNNPNINFIGIEKNWVICAKAVKKYKKMNQQLSNLRFFQMDVKEIKEYFEKNEVDHIFLNFSDPWPKKRHYKNRLTSTAFLNSYIDILKNNSLIELKTDNDDFFNWSLENIYSHPHLKIIYQTNDLYKNLDNQYNIENIATEYENRFVGLNKNINKLLIKLNK